MRHNIESFMRRRNRQTGGLTVFTAVMVLILLTLMIFYAARVGLFSQRISANEVRQKIAFNAAEAAVLESGYDGMVVKAQQGSTAFFESMGMCSLPVADPLRHYAYRYWKPSSQPGLRVAT